MAKAKQNEIIRCAFEVYDASDAPLTGQSGNVTTRLTHNGANASETVTVSEIGSTGRYEATFTPTSLGVYALIIDKTAISADTRIENGGMWEVEAVDLDDLKTEIDANETKIDTIDGNVDTVVGKLPTNYIMGSSDQEDHDDEIDDIVVNLQRALGLLGDNAVIDYDWIDTNNTVATIWIYDSKANAQTHDEVTGLLYKYAVACTFTGRLANIATKTRES